MAAGKRIALSNEERFRIASDLHVMLLDEIFRVTGWRSGDAVFHGGTSLKVAWDSPRFSEDLDFMTNPDEALKLDGKMAEVAKRIERRAAAAFPGGRLETRPRSAREGGLKRWDVVWTHPLRHGQVLVKAEFFAAPPAALDGYKSVMRVPFPDPEGAVRISTPIAVPELVSAWADKVKAVATRPAFKWRDAYDLSHVARRLGSPGPFPEDAELLAALDATAAIYGATSAVIAEGLDRVRSSGALDDVAAFENDMARWFPSGTFASLRGAGMFASALGEAKAEIARACALIAAGPSPATAGARP